MKLSTKKQQKYIMLRTYSHHDHDIDDLDEEFWPMMGILFSVWALWTALVHFIDWLTFDAIVWWIEPFTIVPFLFLLIMNEKYHSLNPLHWWPMLWGYKAKLPEDERITIRPLDEEDIMRTYGGRMNVHIIDYEHIKFRRKKDAVIFGLRNL